MPYPATLAEAATVPAATTPPLTVAYVGNFRHPFCTEVHVAGSLRLLGHTVLQLQEDELDWTELPRLAADAGVLLWTRTWPQPMEVVLPELARLREHGVPSVSYHLDRWFGLDREHQVHDQPFFHTDLVVSPDDSPQWAETGVNHLWLPPGVYGPECQPVPPDRRRYPHDVVFVGSHPYPHPEWEPYRTELIDTLRGHFGQRFGVYPKRRGTAPGRAVRNLALQTLYATAKVVVGDSCLAGTSYRYWSDRIPETLGRGALLIHPEVGGDVGHLGDWYENHASKAPGSDIGDLFTYELGRFDQVLVLADLALDNPAEAAEVAEQGRYTVLRRDTYAHRLNTVLAHVQATLGLSTAHQPAASQPVQAAVGLPAPEAPAAAYTPRRVTQGRWAARFDLRDAEPEDAGVVTEVWEANDYRVPAAGLRGTVLDIGANIGAFTLLAAKAGATKVVAVEPEPANRARLEHHVRLNNVAAKVVIVGKVVTVDGTGGVMVGTGGGAYSMTDGVPPAHAVLVPGIKLATLLYEHGPIELLKVDCEGAEFAMIEATPAPVLAEHVERIALEWHGPAMPHLTHLRGDEFGALVTRLADCGRVETMGHPDRGGLLHWRRY